METMVEEAESLPDFKSYVRIYHVHSQRPSAKGVYFFQHIEK